MSLLGSAAQSELAFELERTRGRTEELLESLSDEQLTRQFSPLQSPLVWDLAHVAHFEELWLLHGGDRRRSEHVELYDAFANPRSERGRLRLLTPDEARDYLRRVREAVLDVLPDLDPFLVRTVVQHELQHGETMAQTLVLAGLLDAELPEVTASGDIVVRAGAFTLGSTDEWAYDNERPAHIVELPAFRIDRALVTNAEYAEFVDAGGAPPLVWHDGLPARQPVQHVSFHEAEAYARWRGKRLPSEAEWEKAVKTLGAELEHTRGAVWQWTRTAFHGYPGFVAFPYREYSEPFFGGDYMVLRGGSWITDPVVSRTTFRNWDLPQRRQIFSGIRCASDG